MKKTIISLAMAFAVNVNAQVVTTLCGSTTAGSGDGTGAAASFNYPTGVTCDGNGNLYVTDKLNNEIRKVVISTGAVTTLCGSTTTGHADGTGAAASFSNPSGIAYDGNGNLYVSSNNAIRKIVISTGAVTTLCGIYSSIGNADGTGAAASFNGPGGIACDEIGNLYVADQLNNEIRKVVISSGAVTTLCGSTASGSADGTGAAASFDFPREIAYDGNGILYVTDGNNDEIRKVVISSGAVTTLCSSSTGFDRPAGIVFDGNGNLYVANSLYNKINKVVVSSGAVITLCGANWQGSADGTGTAASFHAPYGLTFDGIGDLYVADSYNHEIRKITIMTTGIEALRDNNEHLSVYPNPSNGKFTISSKESDYMLILTNAVGKHVYQSEIKNEKLEIDLSKQPNGIYFAIFYNENGVRKEKIIIQ